MMWTENEMDLYFWQDSNVDICVCCGRVIPEGRQVCLECELEVAEGGNDYTSIPNE